MSVENYEPADVFPTVRQALEGVDLKRIEEEDALPLGRGAVPEKRLQLSAALYAYPLDGAAEYRGWYQINKGPNNGKSLWSPKWSRFGGRKAGHGGADLYSHGRETVIAVTDGSIQYNVIRDPDGWGNHIYLFFHVDGIQHIICYAHLDASSAFSSIKKVKRGDIMGTAGCSGNAGNSGECWRSFKCNGKVCVEDHLHIELFEADDAKKKKDPVAFFGWNVKYADDDSSKICGKSVQQL